MFQGHLECSPSGMFQGAWREKGRQGATPVLKDFHSEVILVTSPPSSWTKRQAAWPHITPKGWGNGALLCAAKEENQKY